MEKVVIYSRVSTTKQTTENQIRILKEVCDNHNYILVDTYIDEGISGSKGREHRKEFDRMCKDMIRGKFHKILVWDISRLGRSLNHLVDFLNEVNSIGTNLYIHQSGLDTSTASGKMMFQMIGVFSEFERSMIRERVIAGQQRAKAEGKHIGRKSNLTEGVINAVQQLRANSVPIKRIAKDMHIGVGTVYKILDMDKVA